MSYRRLLLVAACLAALTPASLLKAQTNNEQASLNAAPKALAKRQGDKRPEGQFETLLLGRPLVIGGEYEFNPERRQNLNLSDDSDLESELTRFEHKIELEVFYDVGHNMYAFAEAKLKSQDDGRDESIVTLERGETWIYFHFPKHFAGIQIGRQSFKDKREWWWDADLDAVRLRLEHDEWSAELSIAQELGGVSSEKPLDPEQEDVLRFIGNMQWRWADRQTLDFFWLNQRDRSPTPAEFDLFERDEEDSVDADLNWVGLRARGTLKVDEIGRFYYWADLARVSGNKRVIDLDDAAGGLRIVDAVDDFLVRGTAFDLGATWRWRYDVLGEINLTAGIAVGSGDSDFDDGRDTSFHQTGIQDNNGKYRGVSRFRYYGELFRPELSNMRIVTISIGRRFLRDSSVEFTFHDYEQLDASTELRNSRLRTDPLGVDTHLGREIDIVLSLEEWLHWEIELVGAIFEAGSAFGDAQGNVSYLGVLKVNYNF